MKSTPPTFSNSQIDKLGERLKAGSPSDEDVTEGFNWINEHEFHVKLAGDLLVFVLIMMNLFYGSYFFVE